MSEGRPRLIAIVGPTASGKSSLADEVAVRLGSSVVSVDSMQVYRGMDIGTAKEPEESRRVPLLMVDVADVRSDYSVQVFQRDARACVDTLLEDDKVPVLCGGTGLYLDAVIDEMDFPRGTTNGDVRRKYEEMGRQRGAAALWEMLRQRDARSAELIHPNNVRRVERALELLDEGTSYAKEHEGLKRHIPHYAASIFATVRRREELYKRIDARVDAMMAAGLVDEVKALLYQGLRKSTTAAQAIGYKEVVEYLDGHCDLEKCVETIKLRSRRYAKRQLSWIRRDGRAQEVDLDAMTVAEAAEFVIDGFKNDGDE